MTIGTLAAAAPDAFVVGDASISVRGLTYDSRSVRPGDLFAALPGSDFDGHRYIDAAITNGAVAVLAEDPTPRSVPVIVAVDSRAVLAPISAAFYGHPSRELRMIGLTGTDGKTTTSYLVCDILRAAGHRTGLIGTVGIAIGDGTTHQLPHQTTPESNFVQGYLREMVEHGTTHAVLEATSHGLAMHRLDGAAFDIAGVTNITHEHLEYHKTLENYRRAKGILVERVAAASGVVVLNADDEGAMAMLPFASGATVWRYSLGDPVADLHARNVVVNGNGSSFDLVCDGDVHHVELPLLGDFNVANALCAIGVTRAAGVPLACIVAALRETDGVPGRMSRIVQGQPFNVVVDYAHTPVSLRKILHLLRGLHPSGRLIVVSGSAGERDPSKRPLQGAVCAELADITIVTSEDPRNEDPEAINAEIAAGARDRGGVDGETLFEITDRREAIRRAFALAAPGDCVILAGKGHETSMIWGYEHRPWDEARVAREELAGSGWTTAKDTAR
jgi:UDP-N-acetylmuramoyl-L-alanyl-D-glutamate--2,6-diaminopimelate ligase